MKKVICISGKARSGKDTAAGILKNILVGSGERVLVTHYADPLKFICEKFFNWDGNKDEYGRHLLQYVGTDVVRAQDQDFWADFILKLVKMLEDNWDYVIIPDTRFPNEVERAKEYGFDTVHLRIERTVCCTSELTTAQKMHSSECALDNTEPDYVIHNDKHMTDLTRSMLEFAWSIGDIAYKDDEEMDNNG